MPETLPGCLGYFSFPIPPNGPCDKCRHAELCKKTRMKPKNPRAVKLWV